MPDIHSGYGFAVGNVAAFDLADPKAVVSPGGVGFDINCGVRLLRSGVLLQVVHKQSHCGLWHISHINKHILQVVLSALVMCQSGRVLTRFVQPCLYHAYTRRTSLPFFALMLSRLVCSLRHGSLLYS